MFWNTSLTLIPVVVVVVVVVVVIVVAVEGVKAEMNNDEGNSVEEYRDYKMVVSWQKTLGGIKRRGYYWGKGQLWTTPLMLRHELNWNKSQFCFKKNIKKYGMN